MKEQYINVSRRSGSRQSAPPKGGGRRSSPPPKEPPKPRRSPVKRAAMGFYKVLVVLSVLIVAGFLAWQILVPEPEIPQPDPPPSGSGQTGPLLPVGGDGSASSADTEPVRQRRKQVYNFVLLGRDVASGNTDSIIVVSYDVPNKKVGMISIPRDTAVERTWRKNPKINGAFYGSGPDTLMEEIEHTFGIPIDYYILVDLKGFIALVDELKGVDVDIPVNMNYDDSTPGQELHIHFNKGPQHLTGQQAMEAVRYRHDNDNEDGTPGPNQDYTDVGRAAFQRQVLTSLAKKVISWNSLTKVNEFIDIFQTYVKTNLSTSDMVWFASQAVTVDVGSAVTQGSLPGRGDATCKGFHWCYVFEAEDILPVLNEQVNPYDQPLTVEDLHLMKPD